MSMEPVPLRPQRARRSAATVMFRRRSAQASRRGVVHLRTGRDDPVPPDLARWFTDRGFHFYVAALRWPAQRWPVQGWPWPGGDRSLASTLGDLDDRCARLRAADGIETMIVTARGEGALAAAQWCAGHPQRADALILYAPATRRGPRKPLDIPCPVLVISGPDTPAAALGPHVTWLRPGTSARPDAADPAGRARFFDELGRWLGAYMYGSVKDQLL
jgi:alpha-beta hydrolase superfamily lysophospholipase